MLKNAYLDAKIDVHTDENEPRNGWCVSVAGQPVAERPGRAADAQPSYFCIKRNKRKRNITSSDNYKTPFTVRVNFYWAFSPKRLHSPRQVDPRARAAELRTKSRRWLNRRSAGSWFCSAAATKDRIEIMKWNSSKFERLVLCCMDSYDSEKRRIFQDFSRSTRFLCLRTAKPSKFHISLRQTFLAQWNEISFHSDFGRWILVKFRWNVDENLPEFHRNCQKMMNGVEICV